MQNKIHNYWLEIWFNAFINQFNQSTNLFIVGNFQRTKLFKYVKKLILLTKHLPVCFYFDQRQHDEIWNMDLINSENG